MKIILRVSLAAVFGMSLFATIPAWAAPDGAALYKAKCAACHGLDASGKESRNTPGIKANTAGRIRYANKTSPQHKTVKKLTNEQIQAIADHLATLK